MRRHKRRKQNRVSKLGLLFVVLILSLATVSVSYAHWEEKLEITSEMETTIWSSRTYTLDSDFDEGHLFNVNHDVRDQLQLNETCKPFPFIWVPNSNEDTVSRYDTRTGDEIARFRAGPLIDSNPPPEYNPSRTTVDQEGSCWFGNRNSGTVIKVGLKEMGNWVDRNGNSICDTSWDMNGDTDITNQYGKEILDWNVGSEPDDECILFEVRVGNPDSGPRGLAVDAYNDLWVGTYRDPDGNKFYHIDGDTGIIISEISISPYGSYGAVFDENGILWSSCGPKLGDNFVLKIDTSTGSVTPIPLEMAPYGLGIDGNGHLFVSSWEDSELIAKIDITPPHNIVYDNQGAKNSRGVACTADGDVWVVNSLATQVTRLDNNLGYKATIDLGASPGLHSTGIAVDAAGKVWACNFNDGYIKRINPATNTIDLEKHTPGYDGTGNGQHYSYSDMTGILAICTTTKIGYWTVVFDSITSATNWGLLKWNSYEPPGTAITVRVRSKENTVNPWSSWEDVTNGVELSTTPPGRYIQIQVKFQIFSGETSPILYDLTVSSVF